MTSFSEHEKQRSLQKLKRAIGLTQTGMLIERFMRRFWPLLTLVFVFVGGMMLGAARALPEALYWGGLAVFGVATIAALVWGARGFSRPTHSEAIARLDATLPGRPIQALLDEAIVGGDDPASLAVWRAHQARMAAQAEDAKPAQPDLRLARKDPYALRYAGVLLFATALVFGSFGRVGEVGDFVVGDVQAASGPTWEGWVEPPHYTRLPALYLNDIPAGSLRVAEGSIVTLRLYGPSGALNVVQDLAPTPLTETSVAASGAVQDFVVTRAGDLEIQGPGGRTWEVELIPDTPPEIAVAGIAEASASGEMTLPFEGRDDYGVEEGSVEIALDLDAVDRRHGLGATPDPRPTITVPLPMPITGDRREFRENLIEDFSEHPFANLPVQITLRAQDGLDQETVAPAVPMVLPGRRFFDPLAAAIIEQRRDLLWARANAPRVAQILRAVSHRPEDLIRSETAYLRLRVIMRRLETLSEYGLGAEQQEEIAQALWDLAVHLEEGDLSDALERLRRAQDRLSQAMRDGASDQEIAELMQELRRATDDYMRQLSRQAQNEDRDREDRRSSENSMQMSQADLQAMMDRIQELMEQGRMAEAEQALRELQQLMENMRVTEGGEGQGGQSQGQQALEGLAETLRDQQGLSDRAFRDLQEQFNPNAQSGENQGNEGQGGQGQSGQPGQDQAEGQGQGGGQNGGQGETSSLADRQQALRQELQRQSGNLPGAGTPEGEAARDALDRAGRAMDRAEDALRGDDLAEAIDQQAQAMEALREGMRNLGEALAEQRQNGNQSEGTAQSNQRALSQDPLGRDTGSGGSLGTEEGLLQGQDVYRRARELLDEIRRRSGEGDRPELELDYLDRLLDRF